MPLTNTDAIIWYNVGIFGDAGYAVPNWSNDIGSLNPQILDWTDSAMARAYALRRLAQQFPPEAESKMSAADRRTLHTLGREHLAAFQKDLAKIQTTLNPVLTGIGGTAGTAETHTNPISWQSASEQLLATARRAETLQAIVLGVTPAGASADPPSQLLTVLGQLTNDIEQCQRLLSYD